MLRTSWVYPGPASHPASLLPLGSPRRRLRAHRSRIRFPPALDAIRPETLTFPRTGLPRDPYALRPRHLDTARGILDAAIEALDRRMGGASRRASVIGASPFAWSTPVGQAAAREHCRRAAAPRHPRSGATSEPLPDEFGVRAGPGGPTILGRSDRDHDGWSQRAMRVLMVTSFPIPGEYDGTAMLPIKILRRCGRAAWMWWWPICGSAAMASVRCAGPSSRGRRVYEVPAWAWAAVGV